MKQRPEFTYVNMLLGVNYVLQCLEELEHSPYYRQSLKNRAIGFQRELLDHVNKDIAAAWGIEDKVLYALINKIEAVFAVIARNRPESINIVLRVLEKAAEDPEDVIKYLGITREDLLND